MSQRMMMMGSQLRSGLRLLLGRHGMAKFLVGWLYLLSLFYVVVSQLRISSVTSTRLLPSLASTSSSSGQVSNRNATVAVAWRHTWPAGLLSLMNKAMVASASMLRRATHFDNEDNSRSLRIPTTTYYLNRTTHSASIDTGHQGSNNAFANDGQRVPPSTTVLRVRYNSTNISDDSMLWEPLNWTSLPSPSRGRTRPILYLHAGPYKTASSFLQCVLSRNAYEYLKMDGVAYLGTCAYECKRPASSYDYCEVHSSQSFFTGNGLVKPELRQRLNELYEARQSALMVWEYFSDLREQTLRELLKVLNGWEIHVILNYRRLFEWLPSWYSQKHRPMSGRQHYNAWPGQSIVSGDRILHSTGVLRFPFDVYSADARRKMPLDSTYRQTIDLLEKSKLHPVEHARRHWLRYAENATITVLSMHHLPEPDSNSDPLLTYMFCTLIPLDNTCRAARNNLIEILDEGSNKRFPENYDMLALHARRNGLPPNGDAMLERPAAWKLIQEHQESTLNKTFRDFPLKCISNESLDTLWNLSVGAERTILAGLEAEHKYEFDRAVRRNAFCSVDVDQTLNHDDWRHFFQPATIVVPHVTERRHGGVWWPSWDTQYSIEQLYFSSRAGSMYKAKNAPKRRSVDVVGFVHVCQTDMDRIADLFRTVKMSVSVATCGNRCRPELDNPVLGCLFALHSTRAPFAAGRRCPQSRYATVVEVWARNLNYLDRALSSVDTSKESSAGTPLTTDFASIIPVALVRDPLDRWVEMYQQWKSANGTNTDNHLSHSSFQTMVNGRSLEEFLQLVSSMPYQNRSLGLLQQYQHVAVDVTRAIDLVAGSTPRVLVLIQECWGESLQLLSQRTSVTAIHDTISSSGAEKKRLPLDEWMGRELAHRAKQWLANEYMFYNAAIDQFLRSLAASNVTASLADSCSTKLSRLAHESSPAKVHS